MSNAAAATAPSVTSLAYEPRPTAPAAPARSFVSHAKLIGSYTLLSRILGLGREVVAGHYLGTGLVASAFTVAFTIPNLFRKLFGEGALSAAFIPLYAQSLKKESAEEANAFAQGSIFHDAEYTKLGTQEAATLDPATSSKYSWKLYTYTWNNPTPGEHTLVSRATDVNGKVQPTAEDLADKKSFLEDNSQAPRKIVIA